MDWECADKKEREMNPTGHWKDALNAGTPAASRELLAVV